MQGRIHSTESFGSVDGPGVRFLIFMQGCAMRCRYCHNADTWDTKGGTLMSADELLGKAERYRAYWGKIGGITVSGGEPLLQIDFLLELFEKAKQRKINTCIDTAGQPFRRTEPFFSTYVRISNSKRLIMNAHLKSFFCFFPERNTPFRKASSSAPNDTIFPR